MTRLRIILLTSTFAAAAWAVAQVAPSTRPAAPAGDAAAPTTQPIRAAMPAGPLTAEQREQVATFLKVERPDLSRKLEDVREKAPASYNALFASVAAPTLYLIDLKARDPELFGLYKEEMKAGQEIERLSIELATATPERHAELTEDLRTHLAARFDLVQERQLLLVVRFEKKMERTRALLNTRKDHRAELVQQELDRIVAHARTRPAGSPSPALMVLPSNTLLAAPQPSSQPEH